MTEIEKILSKDRLEVADFERILSIEDAEELEILRSAAFEKCERERGDRVFLRGLIEFSNVCSCDCYYCGIRCSAPVERFELSREKILRAAKISAKSGLGSIVLQSGERRDEKFISKLVDTIKIIKRGTITDVPPQGVGITLSVGEQSLVTYERFFEAGAHRYLLRIETSNEDLFRTLKPRKQTFESRVRALEDLKKAGFIVGTGVMVGLPGQKIGDLANDVDFFRSIGADMIGSGPYLPSENAILSESIDVKRNFELSLKMIACTRLALRGVNIAATSALETVSNRGREIGFRFGANVAMPLATPKSSKYGYELYSGKAGVNSTPEENFKLALDEITAAGRKFEPNVYGDPLTGTGNL